MRTILKSNTISVLAAISLFVVTLACGRASTPTAVPNQVETMVASTLQALTPLASPTATTLPIMSISPTVIPTFSSNPTSVPPTSIPIASPLPTSQPPVGTQIVFPTGATYGVVEGTIQAGQNLPYYLKAAKGQPMIVFVSSANNDVTMSITAQDGTVLLPASQKTSNWQGILPGTQTYYFKLTGGASTEIFHLSVDIPARIQFAAGQNSIVINGKTVNGFIVSYAAYALGGQTFEALLNTSPNDAALTIWGFSDGQPYVRAQAGVTDFSMQLPSTQDYIIDVVPQGGRVIDYSLTVKIH